MTGRSHKTSLHSSDTLTTNETVAATSLGNVTVWLYQEKYYYYGVCLQMILLRQLISGSAVPSFLFIWSIVMLQLMLLIVLVNVNNYHITSLHIL